MKKFGLSVSRDYGPYRGGLQPCAAKLQLLLIWLLCVCELNTLGGVREDLELLRNQCLYFAVGHAPRDPETVTIREGLWAQSPFSPSGEIDLAASGFALACLPSAVECGLIDSNKACSIATNASHQLRVMVARSAAANTQELIRKYGYKGMLFHYSTWNNADGEFQGNPGTEISSIDTALLLYGLMVSGSYFGGQVRADYEAILGQVDWAAWLDTSTPDHLNQFRMAYYPETGFSKWWDWYSHETLLICLLASLSDPDIHEQQVWNAWTRQLVTYVSPLPQSQTFTCYATWNGDPFTVCYGLHFLALDRFPQDFNDIDWFREGQTTFFGHTEFFRKECGYKDSMVYSTFSEPWPPCAIAKPKCRPAVPLNRHTSPIHALAGGLMYYSSDPASNQMALTLSLMISNTANFYRWTGWPCATVVATNASHEVASDWIVGQDICSIALSIDNYLNRRIQNIVLRDRRLMGVLSRVFPPRSDSNYVSPDFVITMRWKAVPFSAGALEYSECLTGSAWKTMSINSDSNGHVTCSNNFPSPAVYFRLKHE
jgi:hypothetical protein